MNAGGASVSSVALQTLNTLEDSIQQFNNQVEGWRCFEAGMGGFEHMSEMFKPYLKKPQF